MANDIRQIKWNSRTFAYVVARADFASDAVFMADCKRACAAFPALFGTSFGVRLHGGWHGLFSTGSGRLDLTLSLDLELESNCLGYSESEGLANMAYLDGQTRVPVVPSNGFALVSLFVLPSKQGGDL